MQIIYDGFEFFQHIDNSKTLILSDSNFDCSIEYIKKNTIASISILKNVMEKTSNLDFLKDLNSIEEIYLTDCFEDYQAIYELPNLKNITIESYNSKLDFSKVKNLETLSIDWFHRFPDLSSNNNLKSLIIWKFRPKSKSLSWLKLPKSLENLEITESNILDLNGLNNLDLKKFEAHYCSNLQSVEGIIQFGKDIETIIFNYCRKLTDYIFLSDCIHLKKIILGNCGDIKDLDWLDKLKKLQFFSFYNTTVLSNDLSKCVGIEYVAFKDKKGYSHKNIDFEN